MKGCAQPAELPGLLFHSAYLHILSVVKIQLANIRHNSQSMEEFAS